MASRIGSFLDSAEDQQLRTDGIPEDNIALFTGEAGSLKYFIRQCENIFIEPPRHCFEKRGADFERLRTWLAIRCEALTRERSQVFVSYAREDLDSIRELVRLLDEGGYHTWFDQRDLTAGEEWDLEIQKAIKSSKLFLACFSTNSVSKKGYFQKELRKGLEYLEMMPESTIFLVPVRLDMCQIPQRFSHLQWCDLFEDNGIEELLKALETGLRK